MKTLICIFLLLITFSKSYSQMIDGGWYFFKYPTSNIFGVHYLKSSDAKDITYTGGEILSLNEDAYLIQNGPNNSTYTKDQVKNLVLTSLFNNSKNISITVRTVNLKRVLLKGSYWRDFKSKNYYVVEGLRADSVFLSGFIKDTTTSDSKDLQTLISTFATGNTVAFKVLDAFKGGDSAKKSGLVQFKMGNKNTFSIVISQKDVYYAAKFMTSSYNPNDYWKAPLRHTGNNLVINTLNENPYPILNSYLKQIDKGLHYNTSFYYDKTKKYGIVNIVKQQNGKKPEVIYSDTAYVSNDNSIHFNNEYPATNDPQSIGTHTSEDYLVSIDYKLDYSPSKNEISIHGYETEGGESTYQNCVYFVKGIISYWPKR